MSSFSGFHLADDVEDRRDEWNAWQNFLMEQGLPPIDHGTDRGGRYYGSDLDPVPEQPSPLAQQLGYSDISTRPGDAIAAFLDSGDQSIKKIPPRRP